MLNAGDRGISAAFYSTNGRGGEQSKPGGRPARCGNDGPALRHGDDVICCQRPALFVLPAPPRAEVLSLVDGGTVRIYWIPNLHRPIDLAPPGAFRLAKCRRTMLNAREWKAKSTCVRLSRATASPLRGHSLDSRPSALKGASIRERRMHIEIGWPRSRICSFSAGFALG